MQYILPYLAGLLTLLILDAIMIWNVILPTFKRYIPDMIRTDVNMVAAIVFYLLYVLVALILVVIPAVKGWLDTKAVLHNGALLGFGAYMTYELTSMSVMKGWSWQMVAIDTLWGTILTALVCLAMYITLR